MKTPQRSGNVKTDKQTDGHVVVQVVQDPQPPVIARIFVLSFDCHAFLRYIKRAFLFFWTVVLQGVIIEPNAKVVSSHGGVALPRTPTTQTGPSVRASMVSSVPADDSGQYTTSTASTPLVRSANSPPLPGQVKETKEKGQGTGSARGVGSKEHKDKDKLEPLPLDSGPTRLSPRSSGDKSGASADTRPPVHTQTHSQIHQLTINVNAAEAPSPPSPLSSLAALALLAASFSSSLPPPPSAEPPIALDPPVLRPSSPFPDRDRDRDRERERERDDEDSREAEAREDYDSDVDDYVEYERGELWSCCAVLIDDTDAGCCGCRGERGQPSQRRAAEGRAAVSAGLLRRAPRHCGLAGAVMCVAAHLMVFVVARPAVRRVSGCC